MIVFLIFIIIISSLDTFISGIALGMNKIRVKIIDILFINSIILLFIIITYYSRKLFLNIINLNILKLFTCILFLFLSFKKIKDYFSNIQDKDNLLELYKYADKIDSDLNKILSIKEMIILVISLSIDNMLICFSNDSIYNNFIIFLILHFIIGNILFFISNRFSLYLSKINNKTSDLLSGILFLILALINII